MEDLAKIFGYVFIGIVAIIFVTLLSTIPIMLLWNWLMPTIFGLQSLTFWEALGVSLLSSLLFKSYNSEKKE